ncbi:hypothetical protein N7462_010605 [Penicillium macrosclerotiorum]|uniref:uncharacterized protein n=1 Tax=Penicillium macrosclerotiorum TaxID=303699 RepID=UPI002546602A|nr:uncharacterized protein N7462_010605 [Penicillium macrosclerotiorum]KAJ5669535.1 hypothetical protein N7462_010605 [Penicillium macrosclerotiorum]
MAQLHLTPMIDGSNAVNSKTMAYTCLWIRDNFCDDQEPHSMIKILTFFFLHVYHAKVNQRTSAMMYIQEAIFMAQSMFLEEDDMSSPEPNNVLDLNDDIISNKELIFPLLWVSERGYSLHLGVTPSYNGIPSLMNLENGAITNIHIRGFLDLVRLFIAFDHISVTHKSNMGENSITDFVMMETKLSALGPIKTEVSTRAADCHITREWMRTMIWQEALSQGLLSSSSPNTIMTFGFPAQVGHDLLQSLKWFSEADLLPLGRDQKLLPFLEHDEALNSILRTKTAEILITAPARLLAIDLGHDIPQSHRLRENDGYAINIESKQMSEDSSVFANIRKEMDSPAGGQTLNLL